MRAISRSWIYAIFSLVLVLNVLTWTQLRDVKARWLNVPPVPGYNSALNVMPGDAQFTYRVIGLMLQNMGDNGGMVTPLRDYDYERLAGWFNLADRLDPHSNFVPMMAAFYFASVDRPEKLPPLAEYLHTVGSRSEGEKWRWLAQAIYITRYQIKDTDKAYKWAQELASIDRLGMPMWTRQMPAFILNDEGNKKAAYDIMVQILKTDAGKMDPAEVRFMRDYICTRTLDEQTAKTDPLCKNENTQN